MFGIQEIPYLKYLDATNVKGGAPMTNIPDNLDMDVKQLIAETIGVSQEDLKVETNFWNDLGVDSIKAIAITVAIERRYKVTVRDEQIPQITTVGQVIEIVKGALRKKQNGN